MNPNHLRGVLWMTASSVMFSIMSVLVRFAHEKEGLDAWKTSEFRFLISIVVVFAISAWTSKPIRFVNRRMLITRGICGGLAVFIFFHTINLIGVAKATILNFTYPIWAGMFAPLLLGDRIRKELWAAVAVAFAGLYLVVVPAAGFGTISWKDMLALTGGLLAGWAVLAIKKLGETDSTRTILLSQSVFGLLLVVWPAQTGGYTIAPLGWWLLLAIGLIAAIGQLQMTYAYRLVGATEGSLLSMLTPVINVFFGIFLFRELVTMRALIGCLIVLGGCVYAALPPRVTAALQDAEVTGRPT